MPRIPYREFEGYQDNGRKLASNCEICGVEVPFVHIIADDQRIYCKDCQKLLRELQEQELFEIEDEDESQEVEP